jgi:mitofusin
VRDFEALEQSLRRFVLEKRARSKLAPARTYLLNILNDVNTLASVNQEVARSEKQRVTEELKELEPQLEDSKKASSEVRDQVDRDIEETCREIYDHTRAELTSAIALAGSTNHNVSYPGLLGAFQYADDLKEAMLSNITESLNACEEHARMKTVSGVNVIKQLGILHVGDEFQNLNFRPDVMFRRRKDAIARQVEIETELLDFVDWSTLLQRQEKMAGTGMALTVAGAVVPRMMGMSTWMDQALTATRVMGNSNLRQFILPGLVIAGKSRSRDVDCVANANLNSQLSPPPPTSFSRFLIHSHPGSPRRFPRNSPSSTTCMSTLHECPASFVGFFTSRLTTCA